MRGYSNFYNLPHRLICSYHTLSMSNQLNHKLSSVRAGYTHGNHGITIGILIEQLNYHIGEIANIRVMILIIE